MHFTEGGVVKVLYIFAIALVMYAHCSAHTGSCGEKFSTRMDQDVYSKHRLRSRVVESQPISRPFECYVECMKNCRCLSYNVCSKGKLCELNSEKKENNVSLYEQSDECDYHEYQFSKESYGGCQDPCCSTSQPCENGARCEATCMKNDKRFQCACRDGFAGQRCEKKAKSCGDFNQDSSRMSGIRIIHSPADTLYAVYCFFNSWSAQTLVLSFSRKNYPDFSGQHLGLNFPVAEDFPNWAKYRLSYPRMEAINNAAGQWSISCAYDTEGMRIDQDYLNVRKSELDPLVAGTTLLCPSVIRANIKGQGCDDCIVSMKRAANGFYMKKIFTSQCTDSVGVVPTFTCGGLLPGYFGVYNPSCFDQGFACSSSDDATTQLWLIHYL